MNKPIRNLLFVVMLSLVLAGCSTAGGSPANTGQGGQPGGPAAWQRDVLPNYSADFRIKFFGNSDWVYELQTRRSPEQRELRLHMAGLPSELNPGDIRLVSDGQNSWMSGEGTDNECMQFPNNHGMDPSFLYPESLLDVTTLGGVVSLVGEEQAADIPEAGTVTLQHFRARGATTGGWKNATIEYWTEKTSGMLYRFILQAEGDDPFFQAGAGRISVSYRVSGFGEQPVEPVSGCEIGVPLPASAAALVRLPGMASFESRESVTAIQQFFHAQLPQENWVEIQPPAQKDGATILSYQRDAQELQVFIEAIVGGSQVKLLFLGP